MKNCQIQLLMGFLVGFQMIGIEQKLEQLEDIVKLKLLVIDKMKTTYKQ